VDNLWEFITAPQNTFFLTTAILFLLLTGIQLLGFLPDFDFSGVDIGEVGHIDVDLDVSVDIDAAPDAPGAAGDITKCPTVLFITAFLFTFTFTGYFAGYWITALGEDLTSTQRFIATLALTTVVSGTTSSKLGLLFSRLFPDVSSYELKEIVGRRGIVRSGSLSCSKPGIVDVQDERGNLLKIQAHLIEGEVEISKGTHVLIVAQSGNSYSCTVDT